MSAASPLLTVLDSILSGDADRIDGARATIHQLLQGVNNDNAGRERGSESSVEDDIKRLLIAFPHLAFVCNLEDGSLPLHYAALIGDVRIAKIIMENFSISASTPDSTGMTPLHYAAQEGSTSLVTLFLQVTPQSAQMECNECKLALHYAAAEGHKEIVRELLRVFPKSSSRRSACGKLPIHFAARSGSIDVVSTLLNAHPEGGETRDWEGSLPLHEAAAEGDVEIAQFLLKRFPTGISRKNMRGETPLFSAVRSDSVELVIACLKAWPHGGQHVLKEATVDDRVDEWNPDNLDLCLRSAYGVFADSELVKQNEVRSVNSKQAAGQDAVAKKFEEESLFITSSSSSAENVKKRFLSYIDSQQSDPEGSRRRKREKPGRMGGNLFCGGDVSFGEGSSLDSPSPKRTYLPLHAALDCGAASPVLECVLSRCPVEELAQKDEYGQLPLHLAVAHCKEEDDIQTLLEGILKPYPEAAKVADMHGRSPLHVAVVARADVRIIHALLDANPTPFV